MNLQKKKVRKQIQRLSLEKSERGYTVTNPNSTYIKVGFKIKGYTQYHIHAYIDTGASICLASKYIFPEEMWQIVDNPIKVRIADNSIININKAVRSIDMIIGAVRFFVPTLYQQESGVDIIL